MKYFIPSSGEVLLEQSEEGRNYVCELFFARIRKVYSRLFNWGGKA